MPLPSDGQRVVLQTAVEQVLHAAALAGVMVDDLHFADEASCEMLQALIMFVVSLSMIPLLEK